MGRSRKSRRKRREETPQEEEKRLRQGLIFRLPQPLRVFVAVSMFMLLFATPSWIGYLLHIIKPSWFAAAARLLMVIQILALLSALGFGWVAFGIAREPDDDDGFSPEMHAHTRVIMYAVTTASILTIGVTLLFAYLIRLQAPTP